MKIVYCLDSINYVGGIQRITVLKANQLSVLPSNDVWVLVADNSGERYFNLSPTVHFVDLDVNYYEDDWKSKWNVLKGIFIKRRTHKRRLSAQLMQIRPDIVVSVGQSEKNILPRIKGDWATIREFHFTRDYRRRMARTWFEKLNSFIGEIIERCFTLRKYDRIVVLTQEDKNTNWRNTKHVVVIPNFITIPFSSMSPLSEKRVIAVGRLSYQKNFTSLIRAFSIIAKRFPEWKLDILGDGDEWSLLTNLINKLSLEENVRLCGVTDHIEEKMLSSSIFALSSRFEGFGLVLLEAMSCGLPCVSYSCPCGPKDIISDGVDGFIVPMEDEVMLAERIEYLIEKEERRKEMGEAAYKKAHNYSINIIISMWMDLFHSLVSN
jgi:glycosyltransferase involved in cell wall biosynthesis